MTADSDSSPVVSTGPRLRFGIIVDRASCSQWQRAVVEQLVAAGDAELALVVNARVVGEAPARRDRSLWRLYNNGVVARRARCVRGAGTWSEVAGAAPAVDVTVERRGKFSQYATDDGVAAIRAAGLDFLFRFGLGIVRGEILDAARFGIWSFHHDDERVIRGGPPSFWEVFDGLPTSGVLLQRLTDRLDGGIPLARATFRTVLHSYPRNRDRVFLGAAGLPAQVARAVRLGFVDPSALSASPSDAPIRKNPSNPVMARFFARQSWRALTVRARGVARADLWTAGVGESAPEMTAAGARFRSIDWIPELKAGGYLADPFPGARGGRAAILVEEFDEATNLGTISALERVGAQWQLHPSVIDPGVHASYPFLVEDDGELYCIPETWQAGRVDLWRAVEFPVRWERVTTLVDGVAVVDPTPLFHDGHWWLFGTIKDDEPDTKLHVWSASTLRGPFTAHPLNPVKIDVTSSRPAGTPFLVDGVLYRPAQDCSSSYGGAVALNRVVALGAGGLVEEPAGRVEVPGGRYSTGTHTLSTGGGMWVVDGRRYARSRYRFAREVKARLRVKLRK